LVKVLRLVAWAPFRALDAAHTGHIGDYVVWTLVGLALMTLAAVF
jgi:hypothetical protein